MAYHEIISLCTWWSGQSYALVIQEMSKTAQIAKSVKMAEEAFYKSIMTVQEARTVDLEDEA